MSTPESMPMEPGRATNLIDAIVGAGRVYSGYLWPLLGASLILQVLKLAAVFAGFELLGGAGIAGEGKVTATMLILNAGLGARLAFDVQAGHPPDGPLELLRRTAPLIPGLVLVGLLYTAGVFMGALLLVLPGVVLLVGWGLAAPAKVSGMSVRESLDTSLKLTRKAVGSSLALVAFAWFIVNLPPALADGAVGRRAEIHTWWMTEALFAIPIAPFVAITAAMLYLALVDEYGAPSTWPPSAGSPTRSWSPQPGGFPKPERVREIPVGIDRAQIKRLQWAMVGALVPALVIGIVTVAVLLSHGPGEGSNVDTALASLFGLSFVFGFAWLAGRILLPTFQEIEDRRSRGVAVQAQVSRVVAYRRWFQPIGMRLQMLRYTTADGVEREACSQIREARLWPGTLVDARYDAADPNWITIEKSLATPIKGLRQAALGALVIGVLLALATLLQL